VATAANAAREVSGTRSGLGNPAGCPRLGTVRTREGRPRVARQRSARWRAGVKRGFPRTCLAARDGAQPGPRWPGSTGMSSSIARLTPRQRVRGYDRVVAWASASSFRLLLLRERGKCGCRAPQKKSFSHDRGDEWNGRLQTDSLPTWNRRASSASVERARGRANEIISAVAPCGRSTAALRCSPSVELRTSLPISTGTRAMVSHDRSLPCCGAYSRRNRAYTSRARVA